jgi:hypothetical protein
MPELLGSVNMEALLEKRRRIELVVGFVVEMPNGKDPHA